MGNLKEEREALYREIIDSTEYLCKNSNDYYKNISHERWSTILSREYGYICGCKLIDSSDYPDSLLHNNLIDFCSLILVYLETNPHFYQYTRDDIIATIENYIESIQEKENFYYGDLFGHIFLSEMAIIHGKLCSHRINEGSSYIIYHVLIEYIGFIINHIMLMKNIYSYESSDKSKLKKDVS